MKQRRLSQPRLPNSISYTGGDQESSKRLGKVIAAAVAITVILAVYLLRLDQVVGQFKDDGWYMILARSLATGHGYKLINLPQQSAGSFYPPVFPFLLSLLYRVLPEFPRNVALLKSLSIASMLVTFALVFRLFSRRDRLPPFLAYLLAFSTALAPAFVMLATSSVMSECVFTTLQFGALVFADRCTRDQSDAGKGSSGLLAALLASAAFLTRMIGAALLAGIAIDLLRRKMFRTAAIFVTAALLCVGSWSLYKHFRVPDAAVAGYSAQFWDRVATADAPKATARDLPGRFWQLFTVTVGDDIGVLLMPTFYRSGPESGEELVEMTWVVPMLSENRMHMPGSSMGLGVPGQLISLGLSLLVFTGFFVSVRRNISSIDLVFAVSLLIIVLWPWSPVRLLVPLLPFLLYYLALGVAQSWRILLKAFKTQFNPDPWGASRIVLLCILAFFIYDNVLYITAKHTSPSSSEHPDWLLQFNANHQAVTWIRDHTPEDEVVSGENLPMLYLFSRRQTKMCRLEECAADGVRYYFNQGRDVPPSAAVVFKAPYHGVEVLDLQPGKQ